VPVRTGEVRQVARTLRSVRAMRGVGPRPPSASAECLRRATDVPCRERDVGAPDAVPPLAGVPPSPSGILSTTAHGWLVSPGVRSMTAVIVSPTRARARGHTQRRGRQRSSTGWVGAGSDRPGGQHRGQHARRGIRAGRRSGPDRSGRTPRGHRDGLTHAALPGMLAGGHGSVLNVASRRARCAVAFDRPGRPSLLSCHAARAGHVAADRGAGSGPVPGLPADGIPPAGGHRHVERLGVCRRRPPLARSMGGSRANRPIDPGCALTVDLVWTRPAPRSLVEGAAHVKAKGRT